MGKRRIGKTRKNSFFSTERSNACFDRKNNNNNIIITIQLNTVRRVPTYDRVVMYRSSFVNTRERTLLGNETILCDAKYVIVLSSSWRIFRIDDNNAMFIPVVAIFAVYITDNTVSR